MSTLRHLALAALLSLSAAAGVAAQPGPDPAAMLAAQKQALAPLAWMDGEWRGEARTTGMDGKTHVVVQTERIGPLLDGTIKLIEGRGYNADGSTGFNAFAVLSYDVAEKKFHFRSHAMGRSGDFAFEPGASGYVWTIPAGPMTIRYTATLADGAWHEVGERVTDGKPPVRFFEMTLRRLGDSAWPGGVAVPMH